jgi:hypothetical protein
LFISLKHSLRIWSEINTAEDIALKIDNEILSTTDKSMYNLASNKEIISLLSKQTGSSTSKTLIALDTAKTIFDVSMIYCNRQFYRPL